MLIKAVLFDIDGTLVDSNDLHAAAWQEAFAAGGHRFELADIRKQIGKGTDMLVPALIPGVTNDATDKFGAAHGAIFQAKYLERARPFPQARNLLLRVHESGRRIVLASSASRAELEYYIAFLDVKAVVSAGTSSDDVEKSKPAPDIFSVALKKLDGVPASEVLAVGDTPYDADSARQCGVATVAVRSGGFGDGALKDAGAIAIYDDAAALLAGFDASPLAR